MDGSVDLAVVAENEPQVIQPLDEIVLSRQRLKERLGGLAIVSEPPIRLAQVAVVRVALGMERDRAREKLDSRFILTGLQREQTERKERRVMRRVGAEDLAVESLRRGHAPRAMVSDGGREGLGGRFLLRHTAALGLYHPRFVSS